MLVEAAGSVGRMHGKNYLAVQHARLTKRRGMGRAQVAVAHSILVAAYWMLKRDEPYHDLGADWHSRRNDEAHTRRLIAQLEHLGHTVDHRPSRLNIRTSHAASSLAARRCRSLPGGRGFTGLCRSRDGQNRWGYAKHIPVRQGDHR